MFSYNRNRKEYTTHQHILYYILYKQPKSKIFYGSICLIRPNHLKIMLTISNSFDQLMIRPNHLKIIRLTIMVYKCIYFTFH
jgi:hypothetical protein